MGNDITPKKLRGFLLPTKLTSEYIWENESTFTQQRPRAGIPVSLSSRNGLVLTATGDQTSKIQIQTTKGGTQGFGAGFKWKFETDLNYYGRDALNYVTGFDYFKFSSNPAVNRYQYIDSTSKSNGLLISVYESSDSSGRRSIVAVKQLRDNPETSTTLFSQLFAVTPVSYAVPCVCTLSNGDILIGAIKYDNSDRGQLLVWLSSDDGDSWEQVSTGAFDVYVDLQSGSNGHVIRKMRMTSNNNSIILIIEAIKNSTTTRNILFQYSSIDRGASFQLVGKSSLSGDYWHDPDIVTLSDGSFGIMAIKSTQKVVFFRLPHARFNITNSLYSIYETDVTDTATFPTATNPAGTTLTGGRLSMWVDSDSVMYAIIGNVTDKSIAMFSSSDDGVHWYRISGGEIASVTDMRFFQPDDTNAEIERLTATSWEGRSIVMGIHGISIPRLILGGYADSNLPMLNEIPKYYDSARFDSNWIPLELPSASSFWTSVGAGSESLLSSGVLFTTSSNQIYMTASPTTTIESGHIVRFRVRVQTGGSLVSDEIAVRVRLDDTSSFDYDFSIRFSGGGFVVWDNNGSINKHTQSTTMSIEKEFIVAIAGNDVTINYRDYKSKNERVFNKIQILNFINGGGGAGGFVRWGHLTLSTGQSTWGEFHVSSDDSTGVQIIDPVIQYRQYPTFGDYLYIGDGVSISTRESPAYEGDQYEIAPRYDFPIQRLFPTVSPSPRVVWKSEKVTSGSIPSNRIAFYVDKDVKNLSVSPLLNGLIGFHLENINFRHFSVRRYDVGTSSWSTVATVDTSSGLTGSFQRDGNKLFVSGVGTDNFYLHFDECRDWIVQIGDDPAIFRRVRTNSEGVWNTNNAKMAIVELDGVTNTEPTSGTVRFIPRDVTVLIDVEGTAGAAWAIEISSQETIDNCFQIGAVVFGSVAVLSPTYGRGRSISYEPNFELFESLDGTTFGIERSKGRRTTTISWTDGVDTSSVHGNDPDPNYWIAKTGSDPVSNWGDSPYMMMGISRYLSGGVHPIVYLPSFAKMTSSNFILLNRYHEQLYSRIMGDISIDHVIGDELTGDNQGEVFRIANVILQGVE